MIYLIYGEERYLVNKKLEEIKLEYESNYSPLVLGLNYVILNNLISIDELITEIEMPPFGYDRKLILIRGSNIFLAKKNKSFNKNEEETEVKDSSEVNEILEYFKKIKNILSSVDIVFIEESIKKSSLVDWIKKNGKVFEYKELTKNDDFKIVQILEEYIKEFNKENEKNLSISKFDLNYMINEVGRDLYTLLNDLNKILFYAYDKESVTREDIDLLINKNTDSVIFEISNNILSGNYSNVLKVIDNLIYSGTDIYVVLGYIYSVYRKIYLVILGLENGVSRHKLLPSNQMFLIPRYESYVRRIGRQEFEDKMFEIMEIDRLSKIGLIDAELGIKAILK